MKWDVLQSHRGQYAFGPADDLLSFADQHGMKVRGHTLLWERSTPDWAKAEMLAYRDWNSVSSYFQTVLTHFQDRVKDWDVINEAIDLEGRDGLRVNTFMKAYGPDYIRRALDDARAYAPQARLTINDYGFDYDNAYEEARRRRFLKLLEQLKASGAPLDQVGVQAHLALSRGPVRAAVLRPFLQNIADMGLDIVISELDVEESDYRAPVATRDQRVADEVARYLDVALEQPAVKGVITWGLTDRHSWLQYTGKVKPGEVNRGLPLDNGFEPKPMYWAMRNSFAGATRTAGAAAPKGTGQPT
jgi:endo-1,4-beta-xylanase